MSEPTIDELLRWLDSEVDSFSTRDNYAEYMRAIRAILEQHRNTGDIYINSGTKESPLYERVYYRGAEDNLTETQWRIHELTAIRAFIERVEKRLPDYNTGKGADSWLKAYRLAVFDELAKLEKETQ